tara:strand:+ start:802 stop:1071 length:270 start_codon:yes stop_codon:yes gene_type:complete
MTKSENLDGPMGWLIDPHNKWAIHFDSKKLSNNLSGSNYTIDMWGVFPDGKPMKFKSRRKVTKKESHKTWKQLVSSNWVELDINKIKTA